MRPAIASIVPEKDLSKRLNSQVKPVNTLDQGHEWPQFNDKYVKIGFPKYDLPTTTTETTTTTTTDNSRENNKPINNKPGSVADEELTKRKPRKCHQIADSLLLRTTTQRFFLLLGTGTANLMSSGATIGWGLVFINRISFRYYL